MSGQNVAKNLRGLKYETIHNSATPEVPRIPAFEFVGCPSTALSSDENSDFDVRDSEGQLRLTVSDFLVEALTAAMLDDVDLLALHGAEDFGDDAGTGYNGQPDLGLSFAADEEDAIEGIGLLRFEVAGDFGIDAKEVALSDFVLSTTIIDNCVHFSGTPRKLWTGHCGEGVVEVKLNFG
jgi:hypothetical protein